jgi:hypothetical protein
MSDDDDTVEYPSPATEARLKAMASQYLKGGGESADLEERRRRLSKADNIRLTQLINEAPIGRKDV